MKILVIGASKGIGHQTVLRGVQQGHEMRAMSRTGREDYPDGVADLRGDALQGDDIARALDGVEAVVIALGIKERPAMMWEKTTLFSDATAVLLPAMQAAGVRRLMVVTGFGAGDSRAAMSWVERAGHGVFLGKVYDDKTVQEGMVRDSQLDWTIARPVILTRGPYTGKVAIYSDPSDWRNGLISRADVAGYLIDAIETGANIREAVVLRREG